MFYNIYILLSYNVRKTLFVLFAGLSHLKLFDRLMKQIINDYIERVIWKTWFRGTVIIGLSCIIFLVLFMNIYWQRF